jgi:hypothetical protein
MKTIPTSPPLQSKKSRASEKFQWYPTTAATPTITIINIATTTTTIFTIITNQHRHHYDHNHHKTQTNWSINATSTNFNR